MSKYESGKLKLYNMDCMELLKQTPDKYYNLCIVDPPYGIGFDGETKTMVSGNPNSHWKNRHGRGYKRKKWDIKPQDIYFENLFRVSKKQIIWGGSYFNLPSSGGIIIWDKKTPEDFSLSHGELAWTNCSNSMRIFRYLWSGFRKEEPEIRIHPTQKPVALYKWLLHNYAKQGDKILDTHGGSMSIAIACHQMGFDLTLTELDKDYFDAGVKRVIAETAQMDLLQN